MKKTIAKYTILVLLNLGWWPVFGQRTVGNDTGSKGPFSITIQVEDSGNRLPLVGANILFSGKGLGDVTDEKGRAGFELERGDYNLQVSYLGYETLTEDIIILGNGLLRIRLLESTQTIQEVVVEAAPDRNVKSTDLGKQVMSIETIESLPPFVGEPDILKSITLLPGVSTVGEASTGFNVRGSNADQNLILLGGAPLYNPSHLFGFFSAFNTDLVQDVSIYKGGIPANYGGRASSIIDLRYKRGSQEKWGGKASVGFVSAKASAGGPILSEKLTLMLAGRASYSNWLLKSIKDPDISNSRAGFYDLNAILDYDISKDFSVRYAFYRSSDDFRLVSDTSFTWSNQNHSLSFVKSFHGKWQAELKAIHATYDASIVDKSPFANFTLDSRVEDLGLNLGVKYFLGEKQDLAVGIQTKWLRIQPGDLINTNSDYPIDPFYTENEKGNETGAYFQHNLELGRFLGLSYGIRYNQFSYLGPNAVPVYDPLLPRDAENIVEFIPYGNGEVIQTYHGWEPRASLRVSFDENTSLKVGYNRMFQYIHLISNTTAIAPTDVWKLSDPYVRPQEVVQYSGGIFRNFLHNSIEASVEVFYKDIKNLVEYQDGARLLLNDNLEADLLNGKGRAYGLELYLEKKKGDLTGWISYTYSRSERRVIGSFPGEIINQGDWYPANFDKPHNLSFTGSYKIGKRTKVSAIFTYSTGRPVSYPSAKFNYFNGVNIAYYDQRNTFRAPDYHRLDMSITFGMDHPKKWLAGDFVFSIYNLYGRKNAFSVFFDDIPGSPPQAFRLALIGIPFPSLSYQFEF